MNRKPTNVIFYFCFEGFSRLGNINNHIRETVSWLVRFGHEVHFFNPDIVRPTFDAKVIIHPIPVVNLPLLRWIIFEIFSFFSLITNVLKFRPDHLYFRETSSFIPIVVSKLCHIPLTIEVNGWVLEELRQTGYSHWKIEYMRLNQRINFGYCDRIIPVSQGLKNLICANYPVKAAKIIPVANGTDPNIFRPIPKSAVLARTSLPDTPTVGFIGSCYHYHGVQYLIKAAPFVLNKIPDVRFVVAGDGAQLEEWKILSHDLKVNNTFTFTGKVTFNLAPYYINSFDICVSPWDIEFFSKISGSPMKLFDYFACGKAVVSSAISPVKEIVDSYHCAELIDVHDSAIFANILCELLQDESRRNELGQKARAVVLNHFTWEITSRKIEKVLGGIA